ncbi:MULTISPECIES: Na+/H+ antiporter NhaC family protein [Bacteria]|uniref:Na+/H+ antiporter NhaC family protein n=1 Tax=Bacteria TaxID=2 RepID=UPI0011214136|nr:Na+/H+ antiporter NhaC family protein [Enterococcus faecium]MCO5463334.1 hypothetical protein [Enterococcus faecium]MDQ8280270.1 Na+/H+ antiporter NhaC family protein [Enterococcus faecium]TNW68516.1 YfcC family protein [Enterococcus faecium]
MQKKKIAVPHILWIMLGILLVASCLTYFIPAGNFQRNESGQVIANSFSYQGHQTPINPLKMLTMIMNGLVQAGSIVWVVLVSGAMIAMILGTGAIDEIMNWTIYKLKDKNENILISSMFVLMVYLGGFGGTDALIAVVPIGVLFANKLKLDPIFAVGVTTFGTLIGFGLGPVNFYSTQMLMGVRVYGSFVTMFLSMNFFMIIGLIMLLSYVKKIRKDPSKSLMASEGWHPDNIRTNHMENGILEEVKLSAKSVVIMLIYLAQFLIIVIFPLVYKGEVDTYSLILAVSFVVTLIVGLVAGFSFDKIGNEFAKGISGMAFVAFVIGLGRTLSLILVDGHIIDSIVYTLTQPLMHVSSSVTTVSITGLVALFDLVIPSNTSKAAILIPILKPVSEALNIHPTIIVQAFQYGDAFTNMVTPVLGWMIGSCMTAGVPFQKWLRWVLPKVIVFLIVSFVIIIVMTTVNYVAF